MTLRIVAAAVLSALVLFPAAHATAQTPAANGLIVSRNSGMCLGTPTGATAAGDRIVQYRCLDYARQQWTFRPVTGGYEIRNRNSGMCLDVFDGSPDNGAAVIQFPCNGQANQRWTLRTSDDLVEIIAGHSGMCLDIDGGSIDDGAQLIQWPCHGGLNQKWALSAPAARGKWSAKIALPLVPVAASTLRNGKVLAWSAYDRFDFGGDNGKTYSAIFDPATGRSTERLVSNTGHDMFCPGTATLPDGRLLVNGGSSSAKTSIYDPGTNSWTLGVNMRVPRGYQGDTVLSTGEVLTIGGSWSGGQGGKIGEVWGSGGAWRALPGVAAEPLSGPDPGGMFRADNHMWLYGFRGGYAFHAGPSAGMNWILTSGHGSVQPAGTRGDDAYAMNGSAVMYDVGKVLKLGGAPAYENAVASTSAYTIDFSRGPSAPVVVAKQKPMAFPRAFQNAVVLPNGQVVVAGGMSYPIPFSDDRSIMAPEIWTPSTGAFQRLPTMGTPRNYHSVATLLLDGRVLVGGGGLCGGCPTNHADVEILTPPYLLKSDGTAAPRPVVIAAPTSVTRGSTISVSVDRAVSSFALVRLSAVTHSVNNDQRRVGLVIRSASAGAYKVSIPSDAGVMIAGDWMLFAMDSAGVPSVAKIVRVRL